MTKSNEYVVASTGIINPGIPFGVALEKSAMALPENIRAQFKFEDWTMMKTFLSASGSSAIALGLLNLLGHSHLDPPPINLRSDIVGGTLLGAGMSLGGSCPGTVLAQFGPGIPTSKYVLLGGFCGAATYGVIIEYDFFKQLLISSTPFETNTLYELLDVPMWVTAIPMGIALIGGAYILDSIFPGKDKEQKEESNRISIQDLMKRPRWNPVVSGSLIGSLQIPLNLTMKETLGTSSAFVSIVSHILHYFPVGQNYFKKYHLTHPRSLWQVLSDIGIVIGSNISSYISGTKSDKTDADYDTSEKLMSVAAGFLLVFGARVAGGCTSGMGLSGMAQQSLGAMIAVASMMGAGFGTSFLLKQLSSESPQSDKVKNE